MRRRVIAEDRFVDSLAALDDSEETKRAYQALMLLVSEHPERGAAFPGLVLQMMKTGGHAGFTPLRLFYWIDDENIYLLQIDRYT